MIVSGNVLGQFRICNVNGPAYLQHSAERRRTGGSALREGELGGSQH